MCGRVRLSSDVSEIKQVFSFPPHRPTPNFAPSWNVAPTDPLPVVRYDTRAALREAGVDVSKTMKAVTAANPPQAAAKAQLERLKVDPQWFQRLMAGDAEAKAEYEKLTQALAR